MHMQAAVDQTMLTQHTTAATLLCRFGLAFGESVNGSYGIFGNPSKYGLLHNVGAVPDAALAATIPLSLFAVFQGAFAIITPALLIGSVADR
jgi:Amt family ammonium transporter